MAFHLMLACGDRWVQTSRHDIKNVTVALVLLRIEVGVDAIVVVVDEGDDDGEIDDHCGLVWATRRTLMVT